VAGNGYWRRIWPKMAWLVFNGGGLLACNDAIAVFFDVFCMA